MKHMCFLFWLFSWILILAPQALANSMGSKTVLIDCQNGLPPGGYQIEVSDPYDNRSPKYNAYLGQADRKSVV